MSKFDNTLFLNSFVCINETHILRIITEKEYLRIFIILLFFLSLLLGKLKFIGIISMQARSDMITYFRIVVSRGNGNICNRIFKTLASLSYLYVRVIFSKYAVLSRSQ